MYACLEPPSSSSSSAAKTAGPPELADVFSEERQFNCSSCGRRYSLKHNLVRHMRYECGGQRRFFCAFCPKKYTQNVTLQKHLLRFHNIPVPRRRCKPRSAPYNPLSNAEN
ncbi:uncharacterized protein LOC117224478 isoform X2 [Megalopta genalis]